MDWNTFNSHNMDQDKAFEVICNQLFENWCKEEYGSRLLSFTVVNGAGGDGGVESYATLSDGKIVGLQAKWFKSSIESSQITQINNSIETALKVRPEIIRYIVCVPRDFTSKTQRSEECEAKRWERLHAKIKENHPTLLLELWNDTRITSELQKVSCAGICRFWFEKNEISRDNLELMFDKAKNSWLYTKYEPDLNSEGNIASYLQRVLGDNGIKELSLRTFEQICNNCDEFEKAADELLQLIEDNNQELADLLTGIMEQLKQASFISKKIIEWLYNDTMHIGEIDTTVFNFDFDSIIDSINHLKGTSEIYFHQSDVVKPLKILSQIDSYELLHNIELANSNKSILFIGNPGTGKTHGVSAFAEKILKNNYHLPIIIQAKEICDDQTWKEIIQKNIAIGSEWSEIEIWQGLNSLVNRNRFSDNVISSSIKITPKLLIIVDGLDEFSTSDVWLERIREANVICEKYPQMRFCFTARPTVFEPPFDWCIYFRLGYNGDVPVYKLFDAYIHKYNITARNTGWLRTALSTPLALKLFCELNQNQNVDYTMYSEISIPHLWREKINRIETEYCTKENIPTRNQYILKSIGLLAELFVENGRYEFNDLIARIKKHLAIDRLQSEKILRTFETYGIVNCYCEKGTGIQPDVFYYYSGIQGYFDYAAAEVLLQKYNHPSNIDFNNHIGINGNILYGLAIMSIQLFGYLISDNDTISEVISDYGKEQIQYYALQHSDSLNAEPYRQRIQIMIGENASALISVVNKLVLPLSRYEGHPLGVSLLDEFLNKFEKPAQRDIMWSIHGYLRNAYDERWCQNETFELEKDEYILTVDDKYDGCPTIYAWALSSIDNSLRKKFRDRLMEWALLVPKEYFKLIKKFNNVNDPQIRSDLYSILVCMIYECADEKLLGEVCQWICQNVLHPDKIDDNRDIAVRYYSIAILRKGISAGVISQEEAKKCLPPYSLSTLNIALNKDALQGSRMEGYSGIDYDLARYVLIDHLEYNFVDYSDKRNDCFSKLVNRISIKYPDYKGITTEKFILSAAYAFVLEMGWNEDEFYSYRQDKNGNYVANIDASILASCPAATHGAQTRVMTICEKYVWQAKNYISGFLCDRLPFGEDKTAITDYGLIDDFIIPTQEIEQFDTDNIPSDNPWYIPERSKVILDNVHNCKNDVIKNVIEAPEIEWCKWLCYDNSHREYKPDCDILLALEMFSCFCGAGGVETNLFVNSIIIDQNDVKSFEECFLNGDEKNHHVYNPTQWTGGEYASCYITPKEVCWFPWKSRFYSSNTEAFPSINISSAVDECTYNYLNIGDVSYNMPSLSIRQYLDICNTNGYIYTDTNNSVKAEYCIAGEKWGTYQQYLWVDRNVLFSQLDRAGKTLVWIMRELRRETGKAKEKYGKFYAERDRVSIGYFEGEKFVSAKALDESMSKE